MAAVADDHQIGIDVVGHVEQLVADMAVACHHTRLSRIVIEPFGYLCLHDVIDLAETFDRPAFGEPGYFGRPEDLVKLMLPVAEFIAATDGKDGS